MTLTFSHGPLSSAPAASNYRIEGPAHRIFFEAFPRRVRALYGSEVILDTRNGKLLHETGCLPQLYVPRNDVRFDLLASSDHITHCPFKGDACYWGLQVGGRSADNAVWSYPSPNPDAAWLADHVAFYWHVADCWFDEDERLPGGLRDPYHRVDVRQSARHVRVLVGNEIIADSSTPLVMSETGLPNRFYLPPADIRRDLLEPSATSTHCPYKGTSTYWSVLTEGLRVRDAAWSYPEPLEGSLRIRGYLCFLAEGVMTEVDGEPLAD